MFHLITHVLTAPLATDGSVNLAYPAGTTRGHFLGGPGSYAMINQGRFEVPRDFTLNYNAANIALTWKRAETLPAGTELRVQAEVQGQNDRLPFSVEGVPGAVLAPTVMVRFGSPAAAVADGVCASQAVSGAGDAVINGSLASGGVAELDVGRGLVVASSAAGDTTQTVTVTSEDVHGQAMVETLALNGTTSVPSKKAHKRVTRVQVSAALAGNLTVGTSNDLGLPVYLPSIGHVAVEMVDGTPPGTAGTIKGGDIGESSATSDDVRGFYTPNDAPNGSRSYTLILILPDPVSPGPVQYAG